MPKEVNHVLTAEEKVIKAQCDALRGLVEKFGDAFKLVDNASEALSDTDTRTALQSALNVEDDTCWWIDIIAVFTGRLVYMRNWDGKFLQRTYQISTDGTVVLGSEKLQVRPETTFVPVKVVEENMTTTPKALETAPVTDPAAPATTTAPTEPTLPAGSPEPTLPAGSPEPTVETPKTNAAPKVLSASEYIAQAPAEMQDMLRDGLRLQAAKRTELVDGILANKANAFSKEELTAMPMATLEKMGALSNVHSYEGRGGGTVTSKANESTGNYTAAPRVFEGPKATQ